VIPAEERELPPLRDFEDEAVLGALATRFERQDFGAGEVIAEFGSPAMRVYLIAHGKVEKVGTGKYGNATVLAAPAIGPSRAAARPTGTAASRSARIRGSFMGPPPPVTNSPLGATLGFL
jgi:hypothetical protein